MRLILFLLVLPMLSLPAASQDRREEYYYPKVTSSERFTRTLRESPTASRKIRSSFITQITRSQLAAPATPRFVIFAKGEQAEHMIIVALDDDVFQTLYRARAVLAQLTSSARNTPLFRQSELRFQVTWFDLAKLLGFEDIVISDGKSWTHRIVLR